MCLSARIEFHLVIRRFIPQATIVVVKQYIKNNNALYLIQSINFPSSFLFFSELDDR